MSQDQSNIDWRNANCADTSSFDSLTRVNVSPVGGDNDTVYLNGSNMMTSVHATGTWELISNTVGASPTSGSFDINNNDQILVANLSTQAPGPGSFTIRVTVGDDVLELNCSFAHVDD